VGILANVYIFRTGWIWPLASALMSFGLMSMIFVRGYKMLTGRQGMGEGDPKLLGMIAAFVMLRGAAFTLFAAAFQGLIAGSILVIYRRRTGKGPEAPMLDGEDPEQDEEPSFRRAKVPFGPFLALGAIEYYFFGERFIAWYSAFIRSLVV
jgi:leader peptidase (prepilin peptidase) / N-methyltransferase